MLALLAGCTRTHYRTVTDAEAYSILEEKTWCSPWMPPADFVVQPHPTSRFFDPTPLDDPLLPMPAPQLYAYELPGLPQRDPARFRPHDPPMPRGTARPYSTILVSHEQQAFTRPPLDFQRLPPVFDAREPRTFPVARAAYNDRQAAVVARAEHFRRDPPDEQSTLPPPSSDDRSTSGKTENAFGGELRLTAIPRAKWDDIPTACRQRIFEFESLRSEYERTYGQPLSDDQRDSAQRLTLEDIVDLAQINSRDYQTQKETLYRAALSLSLERFDYHTKFSTNGHSTSADYTHNRNAGITVNNLGVPTSVQTNKMLLTGGDFLARFANSVVLTFNGPQGFASDIGSDLVFDFTQSVFQRDTRFERLTQAERNLIYAARDFARFRKTLFTQLASQYYSLIQTYRNIEIQAQNYFTSLRAFLQAEAEYEHPISTAQQSRLQVDQVEQSALRALSSLISTCNSLEQSLDNLKIRVGLPTETPLNLDLTELNQLTLRDEILVTAELILRVHGRLESERNRTEGPDRLVLLNFSEVLVDRILTLYSLQERFEEQVPDRLDLENLRAQFQVEIARFAADETRADLADEKDTDSPRDVAILRRTIDILDQLLIKTPPDPPISLIDRQLNLAGRRNPGATEIRAFHERASQLREQTDELRRQTDRQIAETDVLVTEANQILEAAEKLVTELDIFNGAPATPPPADVQLQQTTVEVDHLLEFADQTLQTIEGGLVPIDIGMDDAMLTALVLQFELINERGLLADDWRQIKIAADELKSVLDLNASQTIGTPRDRNRPFAFTLDESRSRLALAFDLPVNRRSQRNLYRSTLISYNAGLRSLMQLEDNVKLAVRNDIRSLAQDKEQYQIAIASAALSFERVVNTSVEFLFGGTGTARDFVEAQQEYTTQLSNVASQHIRYILDRQQLFLDLELLTVDENGFWQELYNEDYQPEPYYQLPPYATPVYGELPHVWYSKHIKRMLHIPPGTSMIHQQQEPDAGEEIVPNE